MRTLGLALLGLLAGLALACLGEDSTLDQDCTSNEHCVFGQECVVTAYQASPDDNPAGTGWCRPKGDGCKRGEQPGCECEIEGQIGICPGLEVEPSDSENPTSCVCQFVSAGTGG